ncbi:WD repeat-containing protein 20-like [Dermatophagoides pteronyssinus]|uniref:WD repeat-containing protein 20-like n=1 Tax=Dermatophagoides pteronyssinus TaxID=6956 RepID=UPI003F66C034
MHQSSVMMMNLQHQQSLHQQQQQQQSTQPSQQQQDQSSSSYNNEIKTQLITREGLYRLIQPSDYGRPKPSPYFHHNHQHNHQQQQQSSSSNNSNNGPNGQSSNIPLVRISFTKFRTLLNQDSNNSIEHLISPTTNGTVIGDHDVDHDGTDLDMDNSKINDHHHQRIFPDSHHIHHHHHNHYQHQIQERICFNSERELFVFGFQPPEPAELIDRKTYKATSPTCHDFCTYIEPPISLLLIGFSLGQIQMIDFYRTEISKFYNQERLIDKSKVTCIRWLPRSKTNFLVSYSSGQMYVYKKDLPCFQTAPNYQQYKCGDGFQIFTCKTRQPRNPIFRWSIGQSINQNQNNQNQMNNMNMNHNNWNNNGQYFSNQSAINEFSFSPCGKYLAIVSQDGFLRVFYYDQMDLIGRMRSYFGGLLCVGWSPDSKFIVTGGEDDLITVWSLQDKRVIARGQGHKSWINSVRFDPFMTDAKNSNYHNDDDDDDEENGEDYVDDNDNNGDGNDRQFKRKDLNEIHPRHHSVIQSSTATTKSTNDTAELRLFTNYRIGSVGQDTQICLWDLTDDIIRQSTVIKSRSRSTISTSGIAGHPPLPPPSSSTLLSSSSSLSTTATTTTPQTTISTTTTSNHHRTSLKLFSTTSTSNHNNSNNHHHNFFNSLKKGVHKKSMVVGFSLTSKLKSDSSTTSKNHHQLGNNNDDVTSSSSSMNDHSIGGTPLNHQNHHHHQNHHYHHNNDTNNIDSNCDPSRLLGTIICPRLKEVPMLEPHVCKKISNERLTSLVFRKDSIVIANHDGKILIFSRPTKSNNTNPKISSPNASMASDVNEIPIVPGDD